MDIPIEYLNQVILEKFKDQLSASMTDLIGERAKVHIIVNMFNDTSAELQKKTEELQKKQEEIDALKLELETFKGPAVIAETTVERKRKI